MRIRCWLNAPACAKRAIEKLSVGVLVGSQNEPARTLRNGQGAPRSDHGSQIEPARTPRSDKGNQIEPARTPRSDQGSAGERLWQPNQASKGAQEPSEQPDEASLDAQSSHMEPVQATLSQAERFSVFSLLVRLAFPRIVHGMGQARHAFRMHFYSTDCMSSLFDMGRSISLRGARRAA